jgi:hypothetical protein
MVLNEIASAAEQMESYLIKAKFRAMIAEQKLLNDMRVIFRE